MTFITTSLKHHRYITQEPIEFNKIHESIVNFKTWLILKLIQCPTDSSAKNCKVFSRTKEVLEQIHYSTLNLDTSRTRMSMFSLF
jgi:hypothetical protein